MSVIPQSSAGYLLSGQRLKPADRAKWSRLRNGGRQVAMVLFPGAASRYPLALAVQYTGDASCLFYSSNNLMKSMGKEGEVADANIFSDSPILVP